MIRPVSMVVNMHHTRRRQFFSRVCMFTRDVIGVVVPAPPLLGVEVGHQQALTMVPSTPKGIIILLTLHRPLVFTETIPFAMGMLLDTPDHKRSCDYAISRGFEEKAEENIHQAIKAEFLVNPTNFWQEFA